MNTTGLAAFALAGVAICTGCKEQEQVATVRFATSYDVSVPLASLEPSAHAAAEDNCCGLSPRAPALQTGLEPGPRLVSRGARSVEQSAPGERPPAVLLESFDGHGIGLVGPHGVGGGNNPSDNSMAVGPNHIVETVNSRLAVYTKRGSLFDKSGTVLFGPIGTNVLFAGFGGECELAPNGDAVVRYDQLADRWLYVMPLFRRAVKVPPGKQEAPYGMCYAVSAGENPLGPYHRYYYERDLFPDYPRPAIWPDGYYVPTSTGDNLLPDGRLPEKHACVVERDKMLQGLPAREQCIIITDVNFLNNADIDGRGLPPAGAPNIMMATGGAQLRNDFDDDGIYYWKFHVDWDNPENTGVSGPLKIDVAPYHYLCDGQLTRCVPQPDTDMRLDAQGDKIMQRLVYRNVNGSQSIVAVHSVNTAAGGGGVRWYEFRLNDTGDPVLHQQSTYAPDSLYRWMASPGMDRQGNIGIGYSFGGTPNYPGQRFAGRLAEDAPGQLTFHETILVEGQAAQTSGLRWQDYTQLSMDPTDDCTFWYVGDYLKTGAPSYTTRIGAFRLPACLRGSISGAAYFDVNHNGTREANEPGLAGMRITYAGVQRPHDRTPSLSAELTTDSLGDYHTWLPADPAYFEPTYAVSAGAPANAALARTDRGVGYWSGGTVPMTNGGYTVHLRDREDVTHLSFGFACTVQNTGGADANFWLSNRGRAVLAVNNEQPAQTRGGGRGRPPANWRLFLNDGLFLVNADGSRLELADSFNVAYTQFGVWLGGASADNAAHATSAQLAVTALNYAYGTQAANVTVHDPVVEDWPTIRALTLRVSGLIETKSDALVTYAELLGKLNDNAAQITPLTPSSCARG
jgi:hypothetical protein